MIGLLGFIALSAVLALPTPGNAADWQLAGQTDNGHPVFVDMADIRQTDGIKVAWVRVTYKDPVDLAGQPMTSMRMLAHFDCGRGTSAGERVILYADEEAGRVIRDHGEPTLKFARDPTGSVGNVAQTFLCSR
jgi:hypothetical protein